MRPRAYEIAHDGLDELSHAGALRRAHHDRATRTVLRHDDQRPTPRLPQATTPRLIKAVRNHCIDRQRGSTLHHRQNLKTSSGNTRAQQNAKRSRRSSHLREGGQALSSFTSLFLTPDGVERSLGTKSLENIMAIRITCINKSGGYHDNPHEDRQSGRLVDAGDRVWRVVEVLRHVIHVSAALFFAAPWLRKEGSCGARKKCCKRQPVISLARASRPR